MKFDISTIFWLFFIFAAPQPLLKNRFLVAMRRRGKGGSIGSNSYGRQMDSRLSITYEEAMNLGLHVTKGIPPQLYQLMSLYPQPIKRQPSVEYLPIP